ncbi:E3 SUMO-protein ligase ZBED1-like [Hippocampus zosterae]|uniref:E3 SUMO-protein ligase ZBED1-like n=1 Tax=Hippocampus zosterae TaxID=109293 RepID=UPI00223CF723|nr:E3 SUMO-protein ligase ZBED1-like [Hippocampus zosterae]
MEDSDETALFGVLGGKFLFKKLPDGGVNKRVVMCIFCQKEFAYHRSSSTLRYHLNAKHLAHSKDAATAIGGAGRQQSKQLDNETGFRPRTSPSTSEKLANPLAMWIALDCRPLSVVEDKGLENALKIATCDPTLKLPSKNTISAIIQQLYDTEKVAKLDALEKAQFVALTGDHWTTVRNANYIGVTAHIAAVTDGTWHFQSFVLTVLETDSRHNAENCAERFLSVAVMWGIRQKITTIGTDSTRTAIAAARHLPFQHSPCIAHILHRTITVSLAECGFNGVLAKCHKIAGHFQHGPDNMEEELPRKQSRPGQENEELIRDVSMRWNSTLDMISCLLKSQEAFASLHNQEHNQDTLTLTEVLQLQNLTTVLEPCRFVTELLGGETYVPCSVVLPALCHLRHTMEVSGSDSNDAVKFKTVFKKEFTQCAATLNHEWLKVATVLDPRFKDLKCLAREEREEVWSRLEALLQEQCKRTIMKEPAKKKRLLLCSFDSDSDSDEEERWRRALNLYRVESTISETDCPFQWWSSRVGTHSQLSVLARKYLSSPATSVPCERLFSLAGHIVTKKRAALSSENVNRLVCLSNWLKERENK